METPSNQVQRERLFEEIKSDVPGPIDLLPEEVEVYVSTIEPKLCGTLIKDLGFHLPLIKFDDKVAIEDDEGNKEYEWPVLGHLRRVRRVELDQNLHDVSMEDNGSKCNNDSHCIKLDSASGAGAGGEREQDEPPKKRKKKSKNKNRSKSNPKKVQLEMLIGSVQHIDSILNDGADAGNNNLMASTCSVKTKDPSQVKTKLKELIEKNKLELVKTKLPGRPAKSREELEKWSNMNDGKGWWPSLYFEEQSVDFKKKELELTLEEEWGTMRDHMFDAIQDGEKHKHEMGMESSMFSGAIVVDPESNQVVSRSFDEWREKLKESGVHASDRNDERTKSLLLENPLNTPILFAIQGVSRRERKGAVGHGMDSESFQLGQYLCTG